MADIIERIGKLLIQAERTSNEKEQDAFFKMAQKLASNYSVELEVARQSITNKELRETPVNKHITIGERGKPLNATFCELFMAVGRPQGLKFTISQRSTYVVAYGFPSDIRIAEAMYAHISPQMVEMANEFIKGATWKQDVTWDPKTYSYKPTHARVARRCFYEAFISRISSRLHEARREAEAALADEKVNVTDGVSVGETPEWHTETKALVLKGKEVEVSDYYAKHTGHIRGSWKGGSGNTYTSSTGTAAGREAGSRARLSGQGALPGGRKQIG